MGITVIEIVIWGCKSLVIWSQIVEYILISVLLLKLNDNNSVKMNQNSNHPYYT